MNSHAAMDHFTSIEVHREGRLTSITINRPASCNALDPEANAELAIAFDTFQADPGQWVAIIMGAGNNAFCAGVDLKRIAGGGERKLCKSGFGGLTARYDLDKPVIAAVNGFALGGGFELVLACDVVIAAAHASFGMVEVSAGTAALAGGLQRLPRLIGVKRAMDLVLTAATIDAEQACHFGIVNEVVPQSALRDAALAKARRILEMAPLAVQASKRAMLSGLEHSAIADAVACQRHIPAVQTMLKSADRVEGARAFAEKRQREWKGR